MDDLRQHPHYWSVLDKQPQAIADLLNGNPTPYIHYWMARIDCDLLAGVLRAAYVLMLADVIRRNIYQPPPTRVTPDGPNVLWPYDGSHRACILRALDRPVPFEFRVP
jgi:hypothetical protein